MKVALVYDRVNKWGGAERVLLAFHEMFPDAPLYTSVYNPRTAPWANVFPKIYTSCLKGVPFRSWQAPHEWLAPLMPIAFEQFNFDQYDLVVSVTSEAAKGIITKPHTKHVCYCLTPTRYLWSGYETYFGSALKRWITLPVVKYLRKWDKVAAQRPDAVVGISREVVGRIKKYYGRDAELVYPPVSLNSKSQVPNPKQFQNSKFKILNSDFFLVVSRLVPYKRVDLAIEAFNKLGLPLVVVGTGRESGKLHRMARSNIHFLGHLTDGELAVYYEKATALIFPQEEDFGIAAVEAQSLGCPVIAYKAGGALETVLPGRTGEFFCPSTSSGQGHNDLVNALIDVVRNFDKSRYDTKVIKVNANRFSKEKFKREFLKILDSRL